MQGEPAGRAAKYGPLCGPTWSELEEAPDVPADRLPGMRGRFFSGAVY